VPSNGLERKKKMQKKKKEGVCATVDVLDGWLSGEVDPINFDCNHVVCAAIKLHRSSCFANWTRYKLGENLNPNKKTA
jgi:hypothetical protein